MTDEGEAATNGDVNSITTTCERSKESGEEEGEENEEETGECNNKNGAQEEEEEMEMQKEKLTHQLNQQKRGREETDEGRAESNEEEILRMCGVKTASGTKDQNCFPSGSQSQSQSPSASVFGATATNLHHVGHSFLFFVVHLDCFHFFQPR